jgi:hypothetical protein
MATVFPPRKDADLFAFTPIFSAKITAAPTDYGLTAADATAFASLSTAWVNAYNLAADPDTRTKSTVAAKDQARTNVLASLRSLGKRIQATPTVTDAQKESLGLPVHDTKPSPVPPPAVAPILTVVSAVGNTVRLRLEDATAPSRRGKPANVAGAAVFSFVGDEPPADLAAWSFEGNTSRTTFDVVFPASVAPGALVWFCACWFNPRLANGPVCAGLSTHIPGGVALAA